MNLKVINETNYWPARDTYVHAPTLVVMLPIQLVVNIFNLQIGVVIPTSALKFIDLYFLRTLALISKMDNGL